MENPKDRFLRGNPNPIRGVCSRIFTSIVVAIVLAVLAVSFIKWSAGFEKDGVAVKTPATTGSDSSVGNKSKEKSESEPEEKFNRYWEIP